MTEENVRKASRYAEIGVASDTRPDWGLRESEFLTDLRGLRGIKRLREMSENDSVIGALLSAMSLMIRPTPWRIEGGSQEARDLIEYCLHHMDGASWEETVSDILSFLPYGFSIFEIVARPPRKHPQGWVTLKKLAPRAQWTIDSFQTTENGDILTVYQQSLLRSSYIPYGKVLHFRTTGQHGDPAGRSVLRSAYQSWYLKNRIQEIEAIAIERELNGLPLVRIPSEYLAPDATPEQKSLVQQVSRIARDVKKNEQGYIILPSDVYEHADGKLSEIRLVDFELIASQGKRDIDTNIAILRYAQDMARSALADFVMLGSNDRGSFALSKSKADLFLRALTGYVDTIAATLNRSLVPKLCMWNGIPESDYPRIEHGSVAPVDLTELGNFIQRISGAGIVINDDLPTVNYLRNAAGLPPVDELPEPPTTPAPSVTTPPEAADGPDDADV
jgi:phage gp29-like protein